MSLFIIDAPQLTLLVIIFDGDSDIEEDRKREKAAVTLKNQIELYYDKLNIYPDGHTVYTIKDKQIREYHKSGVMRYSRDSSGKEWFHLAYTESGKLGWNGKQYSNTPETLNLPPGVTPQGGGFYMLDLH